MRKFESPFYTSLNKPKAERFEITSFAEKAREMYRKPPESSRSSRFTPPGFVNPDSVYKQAYFTPALLGSSTVWAYLGPNHQQAESPFSTALEMAQRGVVMSLWVALVVQGPKIMVIRATAGKPIFSDSDSSIFANLRSFYKKDLLLPSFTSSLGRNVPMKIAGNHVSEDPPTTKTVATSAVLSTAATVGLTLWPNTMQTLEALGYLLKDKSFATKAGIVLGQLPRAYGTTLIGTMACLMANHHLLQKKNTDVSSILSTHLPAAAVATVATQPLNLAVSSSLYRFVNTGNLESLQAALLREIKEHGPSVLLRGLPHTAFLTGLAYAAVALCEIHFKKLDNEKMEIEQTKPNPVRAIAKYRATLFPAAPAEASDPLASACTKPERTR